MMVIMERTKVSLSAVGVLLVCATSLASVDGGWSAWSRWRSCSKTCGAGGSRARYRTCSNPRPQHGGMQCEGSRMDRQPCSTLQPCPVHGGWSAWRDSTSCSSTCGYSTRNQIRTCDNPAPARRGRNCTGLSSKMIRCRGLASCPRDDGDLGSASSSSSYIATTSITPEHIVIPEDIHYSVSSVPDPDDGSFSWMSESGEVPSTPDNVQSSSFDSHVDLPANPESEQPSSSVSQVDLPANRPECEQPSFSVSQVDLPASPESKQPSSSVSQVDIPANPESEQPSSSVSQVDLPANPESEQPSSSVSQVDLPANPESEQPSSSVSQVDLPANPESEQPSSSVS